MLAQSSTGRRSLEQSSWPLSTKSYVKATLSVVDLVELQSKEECRKHYKSSEIISKIGKGWNETLLDLLKQELSFKETQSLIDDQRTYSSINQTNLFWYTRGLSQHINE